jgi:hypothetical protein
MKCDEIRERVTEVTAGFGEFTADENTHLQGCAGCTEKLAAIRQTMALLDEWRAPEPSAYFDVRLQARLREEMSKPQAGWLQWFRRPALAAALTVLMGVGVGLFMMQGNRGPGVPRNDIVADVGIEPGTAVSDLQTLEANHDMYSDFDLLDDLDLQQDVVANP